MILSRVSEYLKARRRATLDDMVLGLDATPEALRDILAILERKGRVRRLASAPACGSGGGCTKCASRESELYEWAGEAPVAAEAKG